MKEIFAETLCSREEVKKRKKLHRRSRSMDDLNISSSDDSDELFRDRERNKQPLRYASVPAGRPDHLVLEGTQIKNKPRSCIETATADLIGALSRHTRLGARRSIPEGQLAAEVKANYNAQK